MTDQPTLTVVSDGEPSEAPASPLSPPNAGEVGTAAPVAVEQSPSETPSEHVDQGGPALAVSVKGMGRMYRHPVTGELYPSITNIIDVIDKPALIGWAARETAAAAFDLRHALGRLEDADAAIDMLKNARFRRTKKAANLGTSIHAVCEALSRDEALPAFGEAEAPYMDQFMRFVDDFDPKFHSVELTVFNDEHEYAGTTDAVIDLDGLLLAVDYKSGKGIFPEVALQLAAARYATQRWDRETGALSPMPPTVGGLAIHLRPDRYAVYWIDANDIAFRAFLAARALWPWVKAGQGVGPAVNRTRLIEALRIGGM